MSRTLLKFLPGGCLSKACSRNLPVVPRNNVGRTIVDPSQRETLRYSGCGPPSLDTTVARSLALESARTYEDGGPKAFSNFLRASVDDNEQDVYLLDGSLRDVLQRDIGADGLLIAHAAQDGRIVILRGRLAAYKYTAPREGTTSF